MRGDKKRITEANRLKDALEKSYQLRIKRARQLIIDEFIVLIKQNNIILPENLKKEFVKTFQSISQEQAEKVINTFSRSSFKDLKPILGALSVLERVTIERSLKDVFADRVLKKRTKLITDNFFKEIQLIVNRGIKADKPILELARDLREKASLGTAKAQLIARTETQTAANFGKFEGAKLRAQARGVELEKRWIPAQDERTREIHSAMNGSGWIPLEEKFEVGGELLLYPGDPKGSARNIINCRCDIVFRAVKRTLQP